MSDSKVDAPHRPIVGLTTYLQQARSGIWDVHASFLPGIYLEGVTLAGGIATLLPPQPVDAEIAGQVLDGIDGLIITGGRDVAPASYGHDPHPTTDEPDCNRDVWEFALITAALRRIKQRVNEFVPGIKIVQSIAVATCSRSAA